MSAKKTEVSAESIKPVFKMGAFELDINPDTNPYQPHKTEIIGNKHELETIALGVRENLPVLLIGETGTGKTSFIRYLAYETNNGFRRLNLNGSTTPDELVGKWAIKEGKMEWINGVLTESMINGYWLLLDELNAGLPEVLFALQSVLDDDNFLVLAEKEGEIIRPHANFRVFATMNPSLEYAGTRDLNKALLSRFPIVIQTAYPDATHEIEIVKNHVTDLEDKDVNLMIRVAEEIRKGKKQNTISFTCSTRELISWAKLTKAIGLKKAAELAILNKCELDTDKKTVEDIFKMMFGKWEKNQILTMTEIEAQLEQIKKDSKEIVNSGKEKDQKMKTMEEELNSYRKVIGMATGKPAAYEGTGSISANMPF